MPHRCHWPGCPRECPPRFWGCRRHWDMLPAKLRGWVMSAYRAGQEIDKNPSPEYIRAACAARNWARRNPDPELLPAEPGSTIRLTGDCGLFGGMTATVKAVRLISKGTGKVWSIETDLGTYGPKDFEKVS